MNQPPSLFTRFRRISVSFVVYSAILVTALLLINEYQFYSEQKERLAETLLDQKKIFLKNIVEQEELLIQSHQFQFEEKIQERVKQFVSQADIYAERIYQKNHRKLSEEATKQEIMFALEELRGFENQEKLYITTLKGIGVMYPDHEEFEGEDLNKLFDKYGHSVIENELKVLHKNGEGFVKYYRKVNETDSVLHKVVYVKKFSHYNWYFTSYIYIDNYYQDIQYDILKQVSSHSSLQNEVLYLNRLDGTPLVLNKEVYTGDMNFNFSSDSLQIIFNEKQKASIQQNPNGGYIQYYWKNETDSKPEKKLAYVKLYDNWKWVIGASLYEKDINTEIETSFGTLFDEFRSNILQLTILIIVMLMIVFVSLNKFIKKAFEDLNKVFNLFNKASTNDELIDTNDFKYSEFREAVVKANDMIDVKHKMMEELVHEREKAKEADQLKSSFLANMSHEIRTPMNAIIGFSELLEEDISKEQQREFVRIIQENGQKLLVLINDIIDLSKIEANKISIVAESFNVHDFFENIYKKNRVMLRTVFRDDIELNLTNELPANLIVTNAKDRIYQIMDNLLSNAYKFTHDGSVTIQVSALDGNLNIVVEDTGVGIPQEKLSIIFERFRQIENSLEKRFEGTGLGLAIVKSLVHLLNGEITVTSELGVGTAFYIIIPLNYNPLVKD